MISWDRDANASDDTSDERLQQVDCTQHVDKNKKNNTDTGRGPVLHWLFFSNKPERRCRRVGLVSHPNYHEAFPEGENEAKPKRQVRFAHGIPNNSPTESSFERLFPTQPTLLFPTPSLYQIRNTSKKTQRCQQAWFSLPLNNLQLLHDPSPRAPDSVAICVVHRPHLWHAPGGYG